MKAVEFDWIFGSKGVEFMKNLANSDDIEIFGNSLIKTIVNYFWSTFSWIIYIFVFLPYMILFIAFTLYTTFVHNYAVGRSRTGSYESGNTALTIIIAAFLVYGCFLTFI